ncbi:NAD(P)H-dependent oxidoreductase subunit E [Siccirubricoccus deserti]
MRRHAWKALMQDDTGRLRHMIRPSPPAGDRRLGLAALRAAWPWRSAGCAGHGRGSAGGPGLELRHDLLIEHLHALQDSQGCLREGHLVALATLLRLAPVAVFETASFYAHFDILPDDAPAPPAVTLRVCQGLPCAMAGGESLLGTLRQAPPAGARVLAAPCMGPAIVPPPAPWATRWSNTRHRRSWPPHWSRPQPPRNRPASPPTPHRAATPRCAARAPATS